VSPARRSAAALALLGSLAAGCPALHAVERAMSTRETAHRQDLDGLVELRLIRVAAPYSRTLYYNDKGRERGLSAELVRDFERWINAKYGKRLANRPITVVIRPMTRDKLLSSVAEGQADIAVGNLTVTDERLKIVDFVSPEGVPPVAEVVVTGARSPAIATADDLSGKAVHVRKSSSYYESLVALNERLHAGRRARVDLVVVPDALEDEDLMEMVNAGLVEAIVVDDWKARIWAQVLPKIRVNEHAVVRVAGHVGWGIRKKSPKLGAVLKEFYASYVKQQGLAARRASTQQALVRQLNDPSAAVDRKRFEETIALFRKYGDRYHFDPLMLAAQGYQESQLDQKARSHSGAIGIMQLMPATAKSLKVGDIRVTENNIHAGTLYMDQLMSTYLAGAHFDDTNRSLFAFACYNAGPNAIQRVRAEAAKRGHDPDKWFNRVELVAAEKIGMQTTMYVRNIYKYYVAYKLMNEVGDARRRALEKAKEG
jgi:membrane-bound lytic murein transglycosylase MltF